MKYTDELGRTWRYQLRPQWKSKLDEFGGFEGWRKHKIEQLRAIGKDRIADWYERANVPEIVAHDGMASNRFRMK